MAQVELAEKLKQKHKATRTNDRGTKEIWVIIRTEWLMRESDANEEVGGDSQVRGNEAIAGQMGEVGSVMTGGKSGGLGKNNVDGAWEIGDVANEYMHIQSALQIWKTQAH